MPKRGLAAFRTVEGLIARLALLAIVLPILLNGAATVAAPPGDPILSALSASLCLADAGERDDSPSPDHELCCILCGPPGSAALPAGAALPFVLPDAARVPAPLPLAPNPGGLELTSLPGTLSVRGPPRSA
jgi:hypothetical protein